MRKPKVSIIIPVYNGANYLSHAIECALNQTYENVEIIVINDGSSDEQQTEQIALSYGDKIKYLYKENGGVSSALNYGISQMAGDYFSWLSHDDGYTMDKIDDSIQLLAHNNMLNKKCIAFTGGYFIDTNGKKIKNFRDYFEVNKVYTGEQVIDIMTKKGTLNGCCMLIPKSAFEEVGMFDEKLRYSQDSLMWYKIFMNEYFLVSDNKPNVFNRIHNNQVSQTRKDLYEHDALYIAKELAEPLSKVSGDSEVFLRYIMRLSRQKCRDAINYLTEFSQKKELFTKKQIIQLRISMLTGKCRYYIVSFLKKLLFYIK